MIDSVFDSPLLRPRDPVAEAVARRAAVAREDFGAFVELVGCDNRGVKLQMDTFAKVMVALLDGCRREGRWLNVKTPPGLGKSVFARLFFAWLVGRDPSMTVGLIAGDDKAAEDGCSLCREIVLSKEYRAVFPDVRPDVERSQVKGKASDKRGWRADGWFLEAAGQRKDPTMGAYASVPKREDLSLNGLFADDLITERTANSVAESGRIERAWRNTWTEGRLRPGGIAVYLMNHRLHGDLGDKNREDRRFVSAYAGVTGDDKMFLRVWNPLKDFAVEGLESVEPLEGADAEWEFPLPAGRFGWSATELALKNRRAFDQLYRLRGALPEDLMFPSWEKRRTVASVNTFLASRADAVRVVGVDISGTGRAGNAVTMCVRVGGDRAGILVEDSATFKRLEDAMLWLNRKWEDGKKFDAVVVESNGVQGQVIELLKTVAKGKGWEWTRKIEACWTGREKMKAEEGLPIMETMLARGEICTADDVDIRGLASDMGTLRMETCMKRGKTPDSVMSLWFAVRKLDKMRLGGGRGRKIEAVTRAEVVL